MGKIDENYILENFDKALSDGYIVPFFQPIIRSLTGKVCSAETLARWDDPEYGLLAPYLFIGVLEDKRLIHKLDLKIIECICEGFKELSARGIKPLALSVNLSRLDFEHEDIFEQITDIFKKYDVPVNAVHLEITESVLLDNVEAFRPVFERFKNAGFEMWLDDFGSGYTSLNVLKDYDFDVLKIDMKFLSSMDIRSRLMIASVVDMAKKMGMHTLAEGVETEEQMLFLKGIGCEMLQGYYFAKPMNKEELFNSVKIGKLKIEKPQERIYYKTAGSLNFLSGAPLDEFGGVVEKGNDFLRNRQYPLAILEVHDSKIELLYYNKTYAEENKKIGIYDMDTSMGLVNDRTKPFYYDTIRQIETSVQTQKVVRKDYIIGGICYSFMTRFLASTANKIIVATSITVFGEEGIENRFEDINKYGRSLFYNFERVTMLYPESDSTKLVYANTAFKKVYGTVSLRRGTVEFAEEELHPDDKERYLEFMDFKTMYERIIEDKCSFVQQPFRIRTPEGGYRWRLVRITRIPTSEGGECYMYSIQRMPPVDINVIEDQINRDPDMFKRKNK